MSSLRPTQHIQRVPALRDNPPATPRLAFSFGAALLVAVISTMLVTLGVARMATAAPNHSNRSIEVPVVAR